jgi:hypothetical protein
MFFVTQKETEKYYNTLVLRMEDLFPESTQFIPEI